MLSVKDHMERPRVHLQAKRHTGPGPADGAELVWKMMQILETGAEVEWVKTIATVRSHTICACWLLTWPQPCRPAQRNDAMMLGYLMTCVRYPSVFAT